MVVGAPRNRAGRREVLEAHPLEDPLPRRRRRAGRRCRQSARLGPACVTPRWSPVMADRKNTESWGRVQVDSAAESMSVSGWHILGPMTERGVRRGHGTSVPAGPDPPVRNPASCGGRSGRVRRVRHRKSLRFWGPDAGDVRSSRLKIPGDERPAGRREAWYPHDGPGETAWSRAGDAEMGSRRSPAMPFSPVLRSDRSGSVSGSAPSRRRRRRFRPRRRAGRLRVPGPGSGSYRGPSRSCSVAPPPP